jgi:hypothetical protein
LSDKVQHTNDLNQKLNTIQVGVTRDRTEVHCLKQDTENAGARNNYLLEM